MQMHTLKRTHHRQKEKRVGRGGKRGTFSGRGTKGLLARAGGKRRPEERDLIKKIPKLRGYRFKSFRQRPVTVNIDVLDRRLKGTDVTPDQLVKAGIIHRIKGKMPQVKILGRGETKKSFILKEVSGSKAALEKLSARKKVTPAPRG